MILLAIDSYMHFKKEHFDLKKLISLRTFANLLSQVALSHNLCCQSFSWPLDHLRTERSIIRVVLDDHYHPKLKETYSFELSLVIFIVLCFFHFEFNVNYSFILAFIQSNAFLTSWSCARDPRSGAAALRVSFWLISWSCFEIDLN